jgi:tetratricopeptide (TPR) repeat protein
VESLYIRIRKVDYVRHAYLGLEGTILLFGQRQGAIDSEMQIPVELVAISESARFKGLRLIAAVLALLLPIAVAVLSFEWIFQRVDTANTAFGTAFALLFVGVLGASAVSFLVLLLLFLQKVKTVRLKIDPVGQTIEFYKHRRQAGEIDAFVEEVRRRQGLVSESLAGAVRRPMGFSKEHSVIPRLTAFVWLALMPAVIMGRASLLILPLGVLAWFAYQQVQYRRQPREYRQAVRSYLRDDLDDAIDALQRLRDRLADYVPAYFFLAEVFTRAGRFEEALDVTSRLADDYPELARQMQNDIWLFKRIHQRRHEAPQAV